MEYGIAKKIARMEYDSIKFRIKLLMNEIDSNKYWMNNSESLAIREHEKNMFDVNTKQLKLLNEKINLYRINFKFLIR